MKNKLDLQLAAEAFALKTLDTATQSQLDGDIWDEAERLGIKEQDADYKQFKAAVLNKRAEYKLLKAQPLPSFKPAAPVAAAKPPLPVKPILPK